MPHVAETNLSGSGELSCCCSCCCSSFVVVLDADIAAFLFVDGDVILFAVH